MQASLKLSIANAHPQILLEVTILMHPKSFDSQHQQLCAWKLSLAKEIYSAWPRPVQLVPWEQSSAT